MAPLALEDVLGIKFPSAGRWSPNPEPPLLAFTWDDGGIVDLYVTGAGVTGASEPIRITAGRGRVEAFDWAPDGRSLVFVEDGDLKGAYFDVLSPVTVVRLLVGGMSAAEPHHSPDG